MAERQQKLNQCLHKLLRLAEIYNVAVMVTNKVQANACTHRVYLRKAKGGTRVAIVIDSPYIHESKEYFVIASKGIEDTPSTP